MRTDHEIAFSQLHRGENVLVTVHLQECFGDVRKDYVFAGGKPPTVTLYWHDRDAPHKIGVAALSPQELEGIDALFRFYKELAPHLGGGKHRDHILGWPSTMTIHAEYVQEGEKLGEEDYHDETGGALERLKDLITRYHKLTPFGQETLLKKIHHYHVDIPEFGWIENIMTFKEIEQKILWLLPNHERWKLVR